MVFLLVGVLGFVPGVTTGDHQLSLFGPMSGPALLGVFNCSVLHNVAHLLFGVVGLVAARHPGRSSFPTCSSVNCHLLLFIYGLVIPMDGPANFVPVNTADNYLHLVLAIGMVALGVALGRRGVAARR